VIEVTLSFGEMIVAGNAGVLRQVNALKQRLNDPDAHHRDPMESHVSGAIAENALAKHLGVYWNPTIGIKWAGEVDGDVGRIEARSTSWGNGRGHLTLHDYSFDERPYVLVLSHRAPVFVLAGWLFGAEGKRREFWRDNVPRPAYFVPQSELRDIAELPASAAVTA
jgi:hypothetical protein